VFFILFQSALETLRNLIRASTTSMTSVPKPLKFMRDHFDNMKAVYDKESIFMKLPFGPKY
jgi:26S proteasome regulatory subunit N1